MTVFLLIYDRHQQELVDFRVFPAERRREAEVARYRAEVPAFQMPADRFEIVTLEADSLDQLKQTHGSYFLDNLPATLCPSAFAPRCPVVRWVSLRRSYGLSWPWGERPSGMFHPLAAP